MPKYELKYHYSAVIGLGTVEADNIDQAFEIASVRAYKDIGLIELGTVGISYATATDVDTGETHERDIVL